MKKRNGFTLLELMIVVAIIMIMSSGAMFTLRGRAERNELIRLRTEIPSVMENATLRAYEKNKSGNLNVDDNRLALTVDSRTFEVKTRVHTIGISPSGISVTSRGAFSENFDILVKKDSNTKLTFKVKTNKSLGVYSVE